MEKDQVRPQRRQVELTETHEERLETRCGYGKIPGEILEREIRWRLQRNLRRDQVRL